MACATYLSFTGRRRITTLGQIHRYAARYLPAHLRDYNEAKSIELVINFFFGCEGSIDSFLQARATPVGDNSGEYFNDYPKGRTPIHMASSLGHYAAARLLLEKRGPISWL